MVLNQLKGTYKKWLFYDFFIELNRLNYVFINKM